VLTEFAGAAGKATGFVVASTDECNNGGAIDS
jgi:hypothetical protein